MGIAERPGPDEPTSRAPQHEHPADPSRSDEGFEPGSDQQPRHARGGARAQLRARLSEEPPGSEHHGRFSEGDEELPEPPEKAVERRFSEGIEESPTSD